MPPYTQNELNTIVSDYQARLAATTALQNHMSAADPNYQETVDQITFLQGRIGYYQGLTGA